MTPKEWLDEFLSDRGINTPSGSPLYSYKITTKEYAKLAEVLQHSDFNNYFWKACFVMYACEWWRLNYSDGHWSWDAILRGINRHHGLSPTMRSKLVKTGFRYWGRNIYLGRSGRRFLGTVVIESGIPRQLLNESHYIAGLIKRLYKEIGAISSMEDEYLDYVAQVAKQTQLPKVLQQDTFYTLIGILVSSLAALQEKYNLSAIENPVDYLDRNEIQWRETFPIRIEGPEARQFLDSLLSAFAKTSPPKGALVQVEYRLFKDDMEWRCMSFLKIDSGIHKFDQCKLSEAEYKQLSLKTEIYISNGPFEERIGFAFKIPEKDGIRIDGFENFKLSNDAFQTGQWSVYLSDPTTGYSRDLPTSDFDVDSASNPLVFGQSDGQWRLIGVGSVKSRSEVLRVVCRDDAVVECEDIEMIGVIEPGRRIYQIAVDCIIEEQDEKFKISPNTEDDPTQYELYPEDNVRVLPFFQRANKNVFIGFPRVFQLKGYSGRMSRVFSDLEYKHDGEWKPVSHDTHGRLQIRLKQDGEIKFTKHVSILPSDIEFKFEPGRGIISIHTVEILRCTVISDLPSKISRNGKATFIEFDCQQIKHNDIPESFALSLRDENAEQSIKVTVPFPRDTSAIYDRTDRQIASGTHIYVNQLHGCRLSLSNLSTRHRTYKLTIALKTERNEEEIYSRRVIDVEPFSHKCLPLVTLKHQMNRFFSLTNELDAVVQIDVDQLKIKVGQFAAQRPEIYERSLLMSWIKDLSEVDVLTFRLDVPFSQETVTELQFNSEKSLWDLPQDVGIWLIYPSEKSQHTFRPIAFRNLHEVTIEDRTQLHHCSNMEEADRMKAIEHVLQNMCQDLCHPDWSRLLQLFTATRHLPLMVMDIWKVFSKQQEALLLGVFMFTNELIERLREEFSLIWQEYPIAIWEKVFEKYSNYAIDKFNEASSNVIKSRLDRIENLLKLTSLKHILDRNQQPPLPEILIRELIKTDINGQQGKPGLRARHDQNRWPDKMNSIIVTKFNGLPREIRSLKSVSIPRSQKGVVYLPFVLAAASNSIEHAAIQERSILNRYRILEMIEFDDDWFEKTYSLMLGYIWQLE